MYSPPFSPSLPLPLGPPDFSRELDADEYLRRVIFESRFLIFPRVSVSSFPSSSLPSFVFGSVCGHRMGQKEQEWREKYAGRIREVRMAIEKWTEKEKKKKEKKMGEEKEWSWGRKKKEEVREWATDEGYWKLFCLGRESLKKRKDWDEEEFKHLGNAEDVLEKGNKPLLSVLGQMDSVCVETAVAALAKMEIDSKEHAVWLYALMLKLEKVRVFFLFLFV